MIPIFSPLRQNEPLFGQIEAELSSVLRSGQYTLGERVTRFEKKLSQKLGYRFGVGCASGTDALILSVKVLNLQPDAEIVTPAFSFVASCTAIQWAGHKPVLADVDPATGNVTCETIREAITPKTKAVIAVDLYGRQVDVPDLKDLCENLGLTLIEDGAQSIGVPNQKSHLFTTSFYPTKNLAALGDAGAILTDSEVFANKLHHLLQHGATDRDNYKRLGTNSRLDALHAAVLSLKLDHLDDWNKKRKEHAQYYLKNLSDLEGKIHLPPEQDNHMWSLFTIRVPKNRQRVIEHLRSQGVSTGIYYSRALSQQPLFEPLGAKCPNAERLADEVLSLPLFPELTERERETVVQSLRECQNLI